MPSARRPPSRALGTSFGVASDVLASVDQQALHKVCPTCSTRYPDSHMNCPQDGAALVAADDLVGTTLGGAYRIVRVIGEGSMGRVYEAQHARIAAKRFAIKTLHADLSGHPDIVARFQREAEAAASIASPHVVGVYDVDMAPDGRPFLVCEFLEGHELGDHLRQTGRMSVGSAVRIVRQLCKALAAAHARGVVHRDMKPENVFLTGDPARPMAKLLDFGISKVDDRSGAVLTTAGMVLGTPAFMAPEQARGERVDHRVDVYAVGAVLYTMLTGRRPFDREDQAQTLLAVLEETPPRPRSLEPSIPDALELVIQRAMAKSAGDRFPTMSHLDDALAPWDPGDADAPASSGPVQSPSSRAAAMAAPRAPTVVSPGRQSPTVDLARPLVVLFAAVGVAWIIVGAASAIGAIVLLARDGPRPELTGAETALLYLGLAAAVATPVTVLSFHVRKRVWDDGPKVIELLPRLRDPVLVGLGIYGFLSLLVRAVGGVDLTSPVWDLILGAVGLAERQRPR